MSSLKVFSSVGRLLGIIAALIAATQVTLRAEIETAPAEITRPDEALTFLTHRAVLWTGRSQVIPVQVKDEAPADDDLSFPVAATDPSLVEILRPATVLAGEKFGFLRVQALRPGRTQLKVRGGELEIEVRDDPAAVPFIAPRPVIIGPIDGAAVWGKFYVGVEVLEASPRNEVAQESGASQVVPATTVQLQLPGDRRLHPVVTTNAETGPMRRFTFEVSVDELPKGPLPLIAVAKRTISNDGKEATERASEPVTVTVVNPGAPHALTAGACAGGDEPKLAVPLRPTRIAMERPEIGPMPGAQSGIVILAYKENPPWSLPVNVPAAGRYQLFLRARGDEAMGALPSLALFLNGNEQPVTLGRLVQLDWHRFPVGAPFAMEPGVQVLSVAFKNDFTAGKEDRNLFLDRYELLRLPDDFKAEQSKPKLLATVPTPPVANAALAATLLYPHDGQNLFGADAVVARVTAPSEHPAVWADVLLDDQPLGLRMDYPASGQQLVFPFPVRGLVGSSHHLRVRVADADGHVADSSAQFVNFLSSPPQIPGPYERALILVNRFAYGPEPRELAAILTMGEQRWLNARLAAGFEESEAEQATLARAIAKFPRLDDGGQTIQRALYQAINSDNPVRSRFSAFIENHFTTWINKTNPAPKWEEHLAFVRLGIAPFADLLDASARSPAMLVYLDQEKSYAKKLNENYAREIMELHTLGVHGGYSQGDVTSLASLLTGWTLTSEARITRAGEAGMQENGNDNAGMEKDFRFDALLNDGAPRRLFGIAFDRAYPAQRYDRVRLALEFLAAHPATAEHVCRKIANHYVGVPAPDELVRDLTRVYLENGGDLRGVLRALAAHPLFWSAPERLSTPQDYALRIARLLRSTDPTPDGSKSAKPADIEHFLKLSGMGLFDRVTPDGYPEQDTAYADSNALLQRWRFAQNLSGLIDQLVPAGWRKPPERSETTTLSDKAFDASQRLIDLAALRLTGRLLPAASNKAARELIGDTPTDEQAKQGVLFVSLLPEANLR